MKGIIFTEFFELVEEKFGLKMVDDIITESNLASEGIYTAVGTYPSSEMFALLNVLSVKTKISKDALLQTYAEYFFSHIENHYHDFLKSHTNPIDLLDSIENHIHVEVLKIYPEAELPSFETIEKSENKIVMIYKSGRAMHYFAIGLMTKTFEYFNETAKITFEKIKDDGTEVKFTVTTINE